MTSHKNVILFLLTLTSLLTPFMGSSINVALPSIGDDFHLSAIELGWVAFSYLLASAVFLLPIGRAADVYGQKRFFLLGMALFTLASFLCAFAGNGFWLITYRVLQGIGSAMIFGTSTAILSGVFPPGERGRALGIIVSAVYVGLSAGPFFGGILTQQFGWQSIFLVNAALGIVILVLSRPLLPADPVKPADEPFDIQGALVYSVTICAIMFGISLLPHLTGFSLIVTGCLGVAVFVRWEMRVPSPIFDIRLFRSNRVFAFSNLAALLNYSATAATAFLLSLYLQYAKGMSPREAGTILVVQPFIQALLSPYAGKLSDRLEPQKVASLGMALTAAGLAVFVVLGVGTSIPFIMANLAVLGVGFALFSSPNTNAIMGSVERRSYGIASSAVATMRLTGQMFSTGIVMLLFAFFIGDRPLSAQVLDPFLSSVRAAFALSAVLCLLGISASLARGKIRQ